VQGRDKRGLLHLELKAPDPAYDAECIFILWADVVKIWGAGQVTPPAEAPRLPAGRPPFEFWEIFAAELTRRCLSDPKGKKRKTGEGLCLRWRSGAWTSLATNQARLQFGSISPTC
jgi:hypothetical protein